MNDGILNCVGQVSSTNDLAREALLAGASDGTAFRARTQTMGRGRSGRVWISRPGDLFWSIVLTPKIPSESMATLTLAAGVAVHEALDTHGVDCRLKWPNDLLAGGRKLGGILVEGVFDGDSMVGCIVGVGINVSLDVSSLEPPLSETATSFRFLGVDEPDLDEFAGQIRTGVLNQTRRIENGRIDEVLSDWRNKTDTFGRRVEFSGPGTDRRSGIAVDLDDGGALIVETDSGERVSVQSGEIVFLD
jgi:BirA family biotin operon repressor/biotin-[acetyl-CoA-carboxylase] ligase